MPLAFLSSIPCSTPMHTLPFSKVLSRPISFLLKRPRQSLAVFSTHRVSQWSASLLQSFPIPNLTLQTHDVFLTGAILIAAALWLVLWQRLTSLKLVASSTTRKIIHISCGPMFVASWPLFSDATSARLLAALVPLCFISLLIVSGYAREDQTTRAALGRALSRRGKAADALQGPLYYSIILLLISLLLFKSPISVIVVAQLCAGDGAAELIGKRFGAKSQWGLPWTGNKSLAGSAAFVVAALVAACLGLGWWNYWDLADIPVASLDTFIPLVVISTCCAAIELIPKELAGDDNLTVAAAAGAMSMILFEWRPL